MILTSRRDEAFRDWTTFAFLRPALIDFINISKFKNNDMSRCKCTRGRFKEVEMG